MAQIAHVKFNFPDGTTFEDTASFGLTLEQTGSNPVLDLTDTDSAMEDLVNNVLGTMVNPLAHWLSNEISRAANAISVTYTDVTAHLDGSPAGGPFHTKQFQLGPPANIFTLPAQVAATVGYRADYVADIEHGIVANLPSDDAAIDQGAPPTHFGRVRPRARDRGRLYLGPLNTLCHKGNSVGGAGTTGLLSAEFKADMDEWAQVIFHERNTGAANAWRPVVWSRRSAAVKPILLVYVDEALTTIRKRADTTLNRVHQWAPLI